MAQREGDIIGLNCLIDQEKLRKQGPTADSFLERRESGGVGRVIAGRGLEGEQAKSRIVDRLRL